MCETSNVETSTDFTFSSVIPSETSKQLGQVGMASLHMCKCMRLLDTV